MSGDGKAQRVGDEATSQSVAVRIAGHEYKIRTESDLDGVREIAGYVDRAMGRVRQRTGTVDTLDVAVLTCLNLAREILALRAERLPRGATTVDEQKLQDLIERVEGALGLMTEDSDASEKMPEAEEEGSAPSESSPTASASRTLELPSVESLRERAAGSTSKDLAESSETTDMPEARVASGGRDRAS